jgi:hypothetical protein
MLFHTVISLSILPIIYHEHYTFENTLESKSPSTLRSMLDIPPRFARWMPSTYFHGNRPFELPIKYDIQENHIHLGVSWDSIIITLSSLEDVEHSSKYAQKELYNRHQYNTNLLTKHKH